MAKGKEKEKKAKKTKDKPGSLGAQSKTLSATNLARYADGEPLHQVQYVEAKLILKPDNFTSVQAFRDFGKKLGLRVERPRSLNSSPLLIAALRGIAKNGLWRLAQP